VSPQFLQFPAILLNFHPVLHPNIWREEGFLPPLTRKSPTRVP
jgi:hypothetical protein